MKQLVEAYIGIWLLCILLWIGIAFTGINLHTAQARKTFNDIKAEVQACNGDLSAFHTISTSQNITYDAATDIYTYQGTSYHYDFKITQVSAGDSAYTASNETYIYNSLYKLQLDYYYAVPLFGGQVYPQIGYIY